MNEIQRQKFYNLYCNDTTFYSLEDIHSKKDLDGNAPVIYRISSNRSAGKTTNILSYFLYAFDECKEEFAIIIRNKYEMSSLNKRFDEVMRIRQEKTGKVETMKINWVESIYCELVLCDKNDEIIDTCGYGICLKNPDALKNYSNSFINVERALFDEFQTEDGKYLKDEVGKMSSLLTSICRGGGKQSREIILYLVGNEVSDMNPWDMSLETYKRRQANTRFLRGNGWVAEFGYNDSASKSIENNRLLSALSGNYLNYATGKEQLYTNTNNFIIGSSGTGKYVATIYKDNHAYGIRVDKGIMYISKKIDSSCKNKVSFDESAHSESIRHASSIPIMFKQIKQYYDLSAVRFDELKTKSDILDILKIEFFS